MSKSTSKNPRKKNSFQCLVWHYAKDIGFIELTRSSRRICPVLAKSTSSGWGRTHCHVTHAVHTSSIVLLIQLLLVMLSFAQYKSKFPVRLVL